MLLSAEAIAAAAGDRHGVRLLQAGPRPRLRRHHTLYAPGSRSTPSPWPTSCAAPTCSTPSAAPPCSRSHGVHAGHLQRRPLRQDRRGARPAAPAHRRGRRDRRARLRPSPTTSPRPSTRPSRWCSRWPSAASPTPRASSRDLLDRQPRPPRGSSTSGATPSPARPPATPTSTSSLSGLQPSALVVVGARPAMGKTAFALGHGRPTPPSRPHRPVLFFSLEMSQPRAHPAPAVLRGPGRLHQGPQRPAQRRRLEEDLPRHRPPRRGPDLDRRQPQPHDHGDPGQGPPAQEPGRRPRDDRGRLPPAHDRPLQRREPPGRGVRDQPWPQDPRPRARDARSWRSAQLSRGLEHAGRQAPDARRPPRVGLASSRTPTS